MHYYNSTNRFLISSSRLAICKPACTALA